MKTRNFDGIFLHIGIFIGLTLIACQALANDPPLPPPVPIVHVLATDPNSAEQGLETATFTVFRDGPTAAALTVRYAVAGSASNGVDYARLSGEVTIPASASSARITIRPVDDALVEGGEVVAVFLSQPVIWPPPYMVCWPGVAVAQIEDNDLSPTNRPPVVRITNPPDGAVFVGEFDLRLIARASDVDGRVVSVEFFANGTSLGVVYRRPILLPPLPIIGDPMVELGGEIDPLMFPDLERDAAGNVIVVKDPGILPLDNFSLIWSNVPPGSHVLTAVATDNLGASSRSEPVRIDVLEAPRQAVVGIKAIDPVATEPDEIVTRLDTATFVVHRTGRTDLPLTVFYRIGGTAQNGSDYRELPRSVTIPTGARGAEIVVAPLPDKAIEGPESVFVSLVPPICIEIFPPPPECYIVGSDGAARAVINDNDPGNRPPVVEIVRPLDGSVFLAPADLELVAQAKDQDGKVVTVEFFEGTNSLGRVTNNWSVLNTDRPAFALKWTGVSAGNYVLTAVATDDDGAQGRSRPLEIKVVERTLRTVVTIAAVDSEAAEVPLGGTPNPAAFAVRRTGSVDHELVVRYSIGGTAENGTDYRLLSGQARIPAGEAAARIVVEPIDDRLVEGAETVVITVEPPICIDIFPPPPNCYVVGAENQARVVIWDNDLVNTNLPPRVALIRPEAGSVFVAPASIGLVAAARDPDGWVREVEFFAGERFLGAVSNAPVIAPDGTIIEVDPVIGADQLFRFFWENVRPGEYALRARATDNRGASTWSEPVAIKVVDDFALPLVVIEATDAFATEPYWPFDILTPAGDDAGIIIDPPIPLVDIATFTVKRDKGTNLPLTVYYRLGGTASNGVDYSLLSGEVTIPAGQYRASFFVVPMDDVLVEDTETIVAELPSLACPAIFPPPPECYQVGEPSRAMAFLRDNDFESQPPKVEIVKPENEETFPAGSDIPVVAVVVDPDGYVSEVEFYANGRLIGRDIQIFIVAPPPGQEQRFSIIWSNVPPGRYELTARATDSSGVIGRSEPVLIRVGENCVIPTVNLRAEDSVATEQDPRIAGFLAPDQGRFRVTRSCQTNTSLPVRYEISGTASNGVDYRKLEGVVLIPAGAWSADIVVDPINDELVEDTETVIARLLPVLCLDPGPNGETRGCYTIGSSARDVVYIRDNENARPRVAIVQPVTGDQFRAGIDIPIVAQVLDPDGWVGLVEFFANDRKIGEDQIVFIQPPPPGQLQRFAMNWEKVPAGRYALTARATDNQGQTSVSNPVVIEVSENPGPPVVTIFAVDPLAREGAPLNPATFRIQRSGGTNEPLTVHYSIRGTASNGLDYLRIPNSVTIPAGRRSVRVTITPIEDRANERFETVVLGLVNAALYNVGRPGRAGALILDNDCPRPDTCALPDRDFHLRRSPDGLHCYRVEVSDDLKEWTSLGSNVLDDEAVHFVDPEAGELPRRFYRIVPCLEVDVLTED